ncbi:hypothetical protein ACE1B6_23010 [Aerosakkonemataceae cyanobacterium BLCC-F154]|uniref:PatU n=1 Tax=Floridaenema fluviatile BLCC-F154 TaxID=3153640 RepID=A0ABV4YH89_9CYAN
MNKDIETFPESFFAWLLQSDRSTLSAEDKEISIFSTNDLDCDIENWQLDDLDLLESEILSSTTDWDFPEASPQPTEVGEIPAVRDRFQALIKQRIKSELKNNPPLFPWEKEDWEYEMDEFASPVARVEEHLWIAQVEKLGLPVSIPQEILLRLFHRSQSVLQSSIAEEVKIVQAVEALFPNHSHLLKKFAHKIINFSQNLAQVDFSAVKSQFPRSYEMAKENERMVLLLLAAKQIFDFLTLALSPTNKLVEREWLSELGMLTLQAEYKLEAELIRSMRIQCLFPCGGILKLQGGQACAQTERPDPGYLSVELFDLMPNQSYPLEVQFHQLANNSLIFAICPTT